MKRNTLFITAASLILTLSSCSKKPTIDTSSKEKMESSIEKVMEDMTPEEKKEFEEAMGIVAVESGGLQPGQSSTDAFYQVLHGKTAEEVTEAAENMQNADVPRVDEDSTFFDDEESDHMFSRSKPRVKSPALFSYNLLEAREEAKSNFSLAHRNLKQDTFYTIGSITKGTQIAQVGVDEDGENFILLAYHDGSPYGILKFENWEPLRSVSLANGTSVQAVGRFLQYNLTEMSYGGSRQLPVFKCVSLARMGKMNLDAGAEEFTTSLFSAFQGALTGSVTGDVIYTNHQPQELIEQARRADKEDHETALAKSLPEKRKHPIKFLDLTQPSSFVSEPATQKKKLAHLRAIKDSEIFTETLHYNKNEPERLGKIVEVKLEVSHVGYSDGKYLVKGVYKEPLTTVIQSVDREQWDCWAYVDAQTEAQQKALEEIYLGQSIVLRGYCRGFHCDPSEGALDDENFNRGGARTLLLEPAILINVGDSAAEKQRKKQQRALRGATVDLNGADQQVRDRFYKMSNPKITELQKQRFTEEFVGKTLSWGGYMSKGRQQQDLVPFDVRPKPYPTSPNGQGESIRLRLHFILTESESNALKQGKYFNNGELYNIKGFIDSIEFGLGGCNVHLSPVVVQRKGAAGTQSLNPSKAVVVERATMAGKGDLAVVNSLYEQYMRGLKAPNGRIFDIKKLLANSLKYQYVKGRDASKREVTRSIEKFRDRWPKRRYFNERMTHQFSKSGSQVTLLIGYSYVYSDYNGKTTRGKAKEAVTFAKRGLDWKIISLLQHVDK